MDKKYAKELNKSISKVSPSKDSGDPYPYESPDTTHYCDG